LNHSRSSPLRPSLELRPSSPVYCPSVKSVPIKEPNRKCSSVVDFNDFFWFAGFAEFDLLVLTPCAEAEPSIARADRNHVFIGGITGGGPSIAVSGRKWVFLFFLHSSLSCGTFIHLVPPGRTRTVDSCLNLLVKKFSLETTIPGLPILSPPIFRGRKLRVTPTAPR